jgi:hypothetical protein
MTTTPAPDNSERALMSDWFDSVSYVNDFAGQLPEADADPEEDDE